MSEVAQFLGQYLNPDSLVPSGTWTGTVFMDSIMDWDSILCQSQS